MKIMNFGLLALVLVSRQAALASYGSPQPITALGAQADLVVLGAASAYSAARGGGPGTVAISVSSTLKGPPPAATVIAALPTDSRQAVPSGGGVAAIPIGAKGLWFLRGDGGGYSILPLSSGPAGGSDLFLPLSTAAPEAVPAGSLNRQLLTLLGDWYSQVSGPALVSEMRLMTGFCSPALSGVATDDLVFAAGMLAASQTEAPHLMGLAILVRLGSDPALAQAVAEVNALKTDSHFSYLVSAVSRYRGGPATVATFAQEVEMRTDAAGLDAAVASSLSQMIGSRSATPIMASLLDSKDQNAALRAAKFLSTFAILADAHGNVVEGAGDGPFATASARQHAPGYDPGESPTECINYWRQWWSANRAALGFGSA